MFSSSIKRRLSVNKFRLITYVFLTALSYISVVFVVMLIQSRKIVLEDYKGYALSLKANPYHINTNWTCRQFDKVSVIMVVHSAVSNFHKRNAIRSTWASMSILRHYDMRIVFFVGLTTDKYVQQNLVQESLTNNDIVQGNFIDSYRNMTHKGVLWLRWVSENCDNAEKVLKIDDDVFINIFVFGAKHRTLLDEFKSDMICELLSNGTNIINRNPGDKWEVPKSEFKHYKYYPMDMCRGYFVYMTSDVARRMYEAAKETLFFWIDDAFLFGILTTKVKAIQSNYTSVVNEKNQNDGWMCYVTKKRECEMFAYLVETNSFMNKLWHLIVKP